MNKLMTLLSIGLLSFSCFSHASIVKASVNGVDYSMDRLTHFIQKKNDPRLEKHLARANESEAPLELTLCYFGEDFFFTVAPLSTTVSYRFASEDQAVIFNDQAQSLLVFMEYVERELKCPANKKISFSMGIPELPDQEEIKKLFPEGLPNEFSYDRS